MKIHTIIFLLVATMHLQAQNQISGSSFLDRTEFKIGYYGNIAWDNGLTIGTEYVWKEYINIKERKRGQKIITHQFLFNGNLGYSTNFSTQTDNGLSTYYGLIWRRTNPKGKQYNVELNPLGYYRSFLPETYEVKGDRVSKVSLPGRGYYAPSIAVGIGKLRKGKKRSGWYLNLQLTLRTNYNAGTLPVLSLHYGHRFNFKRKR
ncbi:hypothetical protein IWQ47_001870 [Aquimarina sp. EL_43]|uniref:hypothetical protein n=1 Tax=Aquimarina TaxID=290174 RepID=UPI000471BB01|nr:MULTISPECIES: hypothetical protein [Aquimarina]MBG6130047.1 hypothetical protein [Aquimarina sp. EL_35]MBG6148827.1 hypothetical protein [Aquimarina sp. EL_32]MBG6168799.1 hypothetical protein [Aquimarina sp. EL_43]